MCKKQKLSLLLAGIFIMMTVFAGCGANTATPPAATSDGNQIKKVKLGYSGGACEAFLFAAYEKGFLKEEGLDAELVKVDFETLKESLTTGKIQASSGMVMKFVKPAEQGVDLVFTSGIHTGCIQLLVPSNSSIKTVNDLKGKIIGNNGMGDGPMIFVTRALQKAGLNYKDDVQWRAYPAPELAGALERGEVDAITLSDPIAQMVVDSGKARKLLNTTVDQPYHDEYCCMATISGKYFKDDPAGAAAITRALMKGAKWVSENPDEAAKLIVEKKYIPGNPELVARLLKSYNYVPSVDGGERAVDNAVKELKSAGVLDPNTNIEELKHHLFRHAQGVN